MTYKIDVPTEKWKFTKFVNTLTDEVYCSTNADRIRAMTDEELADLFISVGDGNTPEKIVFSARDMGYEQKMWLDWLKKEEAK